MTSHVKTAVTSAPILPVLADRWSPRSYDPSYKLTQHELLSILEAGRWAPSANNAQPTRYSVIEHGSALHEQIVGTLSGWNSAWAGNASAIILVSAEVTKADGSTNEFAIYDAGQAVAHLTVQAHELGLHVHTMGGINHVALAETLDLPEELQLLVVLTIGKVAPAEQLEGPAYEREIAPRTRLDLDEIVLVGKP